MKRCLIMFLLFIIALLLSIIAESPKNDLSEDSIVIASEDATFKISETK